MNCRLAFTIQLGSVGSFVYIRQILHVHMKQMIDAWDVEAMSLSQSPLRVDFLRIRSYGAMNSQAFSQAEPISDPGFFILRSTRSCSKAPPVKLSEHSQFVIA